MKSFKPLFKKIAKERGKFALTFWFDQRYYTKPEQMLKEQKRLEKQIQSYQHSNIIKKEIESKKIILILNSPEAVDPIFKEVSHGYKGLVYDVFLVDDNDNPYGRSWPLYDLLKRMNVAQGLIYFYDEIINSGLVSKNLKSELIQEIREDGAKQLRKWGLEDKIETWNSFIR